MLHSSVAITSPKLTCSFLSTSTSSDSHRRSLIRLSRFKILSKIDDGSAEQFLQKSAIADFMRLKRDNHAQFQTAVVSYRKKFPSSRLQPFPQVSAIHIGDKDLRRVSAPPVTTKFESDYYEVDAWSETVKSLDFLPSTLENVIVPAPEASSGAKTSRKERNPKRLSSSAAESKKPDNLPVIRYPLTTESAIRAIVEHNTLVFVVDKRADKNIIKDTVKEMFKIKAKKVNTSIMPDGTKKAYVMLAPEFNASDVAKKFKIL